MKIYAEDIGKTFYTRSGIPVRISGSKVTTVGSEVQTRFVVEVVGRSPVTAANKGWILGDTYSVADNGAYTILGEMDCDIVHKGPLTNSSLVCYYQNLLKKAVKRHEQEIEYHEGQIQKLREKIKLAEEGHYE